jgi:hypothetical protein
VACRTIVFLVTDPYPLQERPDAIGGLPPTAPYPYLPETIEPPLLTIGDITVTRTAVIVPQGRYPLRGTTWTVQDSTLVSESIPAYAIVLAIIFAVFCLLGLLFLLIKERRYSGFITVTVVGAQFYHTVQFPPGPQIAGWVTAQVNSARALAATA